MISDAINSVFAQTYSNYEIIVVDGGSKDGTLEILKVLGAKIKLVHQTDKGVANARNRGIKEASGQLIAFLDSDDLWLPKKLELQVNYLQSHPEIGLLHTGYKVVNTEGNLLGSNLLISERLVDHQEFAALELISNRIGLLTVCLRRSILADYNLFDPTMRAAEDWNAWVHLIVSGSKIAYLPEILSVYKTHSLSLSFSPASIHLVEDAIHNWILEQPLSFLHPKKEAAIKTQVKLMKYLRAAALSYRFEDKISACNQLKELVNTIKPDNLPLRFLATFAGQVTSDLWLSRPEKVKVELEALDFGYSCIDFPGNNLAHAKEQKNLTLYLSKAAILRQISKKSSYPYLLKALSASPPFLKGFIHFILQKITGRIKVYYRKVIYDLIFSLDFMFRAK